MRREQMGIKHKLFYGTMALHQWVAKRQGGSIQFIPDYLKNCIATQPMAYDAVGTTQRENFYGQYDYVRYRTIELLASEIYQHQVEGEIAEAGVDCGECSWVINAAFPDRKMYLYDTFTGFDQRDVEIEKQNRYTTKSFFENSNYFKRERFQSSEEQMEFVKKRLQHPENVSFRKGYFPETAKGEKDNRFAFVSLDMDLYQPIRKGIEFFYPCLNKGGFMMIHDYNHREFLGIKKAVAECEELFGPLATVPIPDQGGTVVIAKVTE